MRVLVALFFSGLVCNSWSQVPILNQQSRIQRQMILNENPSHSSLQGFENTFLFTSELNTYGTYQNKIGTFSISPLLSFSGGTDRRSRLLYQNEIGFIAGLQSTSKKVSLSLAPSLGNASYPYFTQWEAVRTQHAPAKGYTATNPVLGRWNFASFLGAFQYRPSNHFTLNIGNGRHFIGNGYRSLLLSDFSRPHPYAAITTKVWRIKYVNLFSAYAQDPTRDQFFYRPNKFSTIHYLSWEVTEKFTLGLFEAVVWKAKDTLLNRGFDINYLNPVIFYRPVEYATGSSDNVLMAIDMKWEPTSSLAVYGQFLLDEFLLRYIRADIKSKLRPGQPTDEPPGWWANKHAGQFGVIATEPFRAKGLRLQAEVNYVRPYTYTHVGPTENYGNYNAPLAHPYGANFVEWLAFAQYTKGNWWFELSWQNTLRGMPNRLTQENNGSDIFLPYQTRAQEFGNRIGQGKAHRIHYYLAEVSYLVNVQSNMRAFIKGGFRTDQALATGNTRLDNWVMVGVSSSLFNDYTRF